MKFIGLALLAGLNADLNVAGSVYLNQPTLFNKDPSALGETTRGINVETSLKMVADVNDDVTVSTKVCFGCHGFMSGMAYAEWNLTENVAVRAGRFPVPFGEFYLRHDPANHRSATKPLPYAMGRMLRDDAFNLGVVPQPYPDNGVEIHGNTQGEMLELGFHLYAVQGLKGNQAVADLDFTQSRSTEYFADNNRTPTVGARATIGFPTLPTASWRFLQFGASALYGYYDSEDELFYAMGGLDMYTRIKKINLRAEVLFRRTAVPDQPENFAQELDDLYVQREGFYVQLDGPMSKTVEGLARVDGLRRAGPTLPTAEISVDSKILRYTGGINVLPVKGFKLKFNYEYWRFSDFGDEQILHTGFVGTF